MDRGAPIRPDQHLREADVDLLAWVRQSGSEPDPESAELENLHRHEAVCAECRNRVKAREEEMGAMRFMLAQAERESDQHCPPAEVWPLAAAGLCPSAFEAQHAARCSRCGPLLRQALSDILADPTAEERDAVAKLPSSSPGMARIIAQRLAAEVGANSGGGGPGKSQLWVRRGAWLALTAMVTIVASLGFWLHQRKVADPEFLLAQSYSANRTIEWRFPGAMESPLRLTRGESHARSATPDLLRLEARISEQMAAHPNEAYWMTLDGRLDLLQWKYAEALEEFKRVGELRPDSVPALIDLAGAYFERAEATGRSFDYGMAIDLLSKALQKQPQNPVALFNRALTNERMYLYGRAAADWQQLLAVEPTGAWSTEARSHLEQAKKKLNDH